MDKALRAKYLYITLSILALCAYSFVATATTLAPGTPPSVGGYAVDEFILDPGCEPGDAVANGDPYDCFKNISDGTPYELYAENPSSPTDPVASGTNAVAIGNSAIANETNEIMFGNKMLNLRSQGFVFNDDNFAYNGTTSYVVGSTTNTVNLGSLDDVTFGGTYTGSSTTDTYEVVIESSGTTYEFLFNSVSVSTGNTITAGVPDALQDGITVTFGSGSYTDTEAWEMTPISSSTEETKFFFDYTNKIVRIGSVNNSNWDTGSSGTRSVAMGFSSPGYAAPIASGQNSFAFGSDTVASGTRATAFGVETSASGENAIVFGSGSIASNTNTTAFGLQTTASGLQSTAFGWVTAASGDASTAFGLDTTASGESASAFGNNTLASGAESTAFGNGSIASGQVSTAFGSSTTASGLQSTAFGSSTTASGNISVAMGRSMLARSFGEIAVGTGNTNYTPVSTSAFDASDRLFVVGNGNGSGSDAFTILKNGKVGIGIDSFENTSYQITPNTALLQIDGDVAASGDVYASGLALTSDERLKENIEDISYGLDTITKLRPVAYNLRSDGSYQFGFIAQEVRQELPSLVNENRYLSLNYIGIIPILTKAVQELDVKLSEIESISQTILTTSAIAQWLGDIANGLEQIFAGRIKTNELCIGDTCVTEDQLRELLSNQHIQEGQSYVGEPNIQDSSDESLPDESEDQVQDLGSDQVQSNDTPMEPEDPQEEYSDMQIEEPVVETPQEPGV